MNNKSTSIRRHYETTVNDVNTKLKEIKSTDTLVKNNQLISNEKTRLDNETKNEKSRLTLLNVNEIVKL